MSTPPQGEGWRPGEPPGAGPPWQQGPWLHPPGPPPPTGKGLKWVLVAVAVLLVIATAVGVTVIVLTSNEDSDATTSSASGAPSEGVERSTGNAVLEDFSATVALYLRDCVVVGDNYTGADSQLPYVSVKLNQVARGACRAAWG